jgi:hypothetical protein
MSKKKTTQETMSPALLTTAQLEQSGIKTSLNQNDIVEIIAVEAYDSIMQTIQSAPQFDVDLFNMDECKESFVKEVNKIKGHNLIFTSSDVSTTGSDYKGINKSYICNRIHIEESSNESVRVYLKRSNYHYNSEASYKLRIMKYLDSVTSGDLSTVLVEQSNGRFEFAKKVNLKASISQKQFETMLENHNQAVLDLYNSIPVAEKTTNGDSYKLVNFKSISTQARVSVNKNIIKNQAPEVTEQLNKLFGINM